MQFGTGRQIVIKNRSPHVHVGLCVPPLSQEFCQALFKPEGKYELNIILNNGLNRPTVIDIIDIGVQKLVLNVSSKVCIIAPNRLRIETIVILCFSYARLLSDEPPY